MSKNSISGQREVLNVYYVEILMGCNLKSTIFYPYAKTVHCTHKKYAQVDHALTHTHTVGLFTNEYAEVFILEPVLSLLSASHVVSLTVLSLNLSQTRRAGWWT